MAKYSQDFVRDVSGSHHHPCQLPADFWVFKFGTPRLQVHVLRKEAQRSWRISSRSRRRKEAQRSRAQLVPREIRVVSFLSWTRKQILSDPQHQTLVMVVGVASREAGVGFWAIL